MRLVKLLLNCTAGIIGIATLVVLGGHFGIVDTVKPYIVQSGSMAPAIPLGSVVLVRGAPLYNQNDVISFHPEGNVKNIVTHRILFKRYPQGLSEPEALRAGGQPSYLTIGDANEDVDRYEVKSADIVGKVYFTIPYIGYAVDFAKTPKGFILLVIIPATIIVYEELRSIMRELARLFGRRRHSGLSRIPSVDSGQADSGVPFGFAQGPQNDGMVGRTQLATAEETVVIERGMPKAAVVIPIVGVTLVFVALTGAFFLDHEQSTSNIMSAAVEFVTPTPTIEPEASPSALPTSVQATPTP